MLKVGREAPDFEAIADDGSAFKLSDRLRDGHVVLYFYPRDFTPGCIAEACGFRDNHNAITQQGAAIVGISPDSQDSHRRFKEKYGVTFPLISDPDRRVISLYEADRGIGGLLTTRRVTYVIDRDGVIRGVYHHEIAIRRHHVNVVYALETINRKERPDC